MGWDYWTYMAQPTFFLEAVGKLIDQERTNAKSTNTKTNISN